MNKQNLETSKKRKLVTAGMAVLGVSLIVGGAFAALSDTLSHDETITIEWVDIVDGSSTNLALEDVSDVNNTPVSELTPGVTYELTGVLENASTVPTDWTATNLTTTPGMSVTIADVDGLDTALAVGEDLDVSQFGITVQVDQSVTPSTDLNFVIEFSSVDARSHALTEPTAINEVFIDPATATCIANDDEIINITGGDVNYVITQAELDSITTLNCASQGITSIEGIQYLTNLTTLDLHDNNISDLTPLSGLNKLTKLELYTNEISDISPLANLTNLVHLDLGVNQITNIDAVANLVNLEYLSFSTNEISDITPLTNLVNLKTLNLNKNNISDITPTINMMNLTNLYLGENQVTDFSSLTYRPTSLGAIGQNVVLPDKPLGNATPITIDGINGEDLIITWITPGTYVNGQLTWENPGVNSLTYASSDGSITGTITQTITPKPTLAQPTAISAIFNDPALAACVANDDESGAAGNVNYVISQAELNNITDLNCANQGVTNIEGLQYLNNLTILELQDNAITDLTPLTSMTSLIIIDLSNNQVTDITPVTNLTNLTNLDLSYNNVEDISPVANLTNMGTMDLYDNEITDITPLTNLTKLNKLNIASNQVSDISVLKNMNNLTVLYLEENQISDFSSLTYQAVTFYGGAQNVVLPDTTLGTPTDIIIEGVSGEDLIITFNTPGTYVNGELTWDNPGVNSLTYASSDGTITGTITQTVY